MDTILNKHIPMQNPNDSRTTAHTLVWLVIGLFFIWGGITSLNDILIPKLKDLFSLSYTEVMLTQFAFFMAYAIVSVPAGTLVSRLGYMKGIVCGLGIMAVGCLLFIPAANLATYEIFLIALFILAGGITILQVAANPLIANLGPTETSHSRLTFAQAFNALGTTIAPFIGAKLILDSLEDKDPVTLTGAELTAFRVEEASILSHTYMALATTLLVIAIIFWLSRNRFHHKTDIEQANLKQSLTLLSRPRLLFGMLAIFLYVGAEVTIGSFLVNYLMLPSTMATTAKTAGELIAFYWGGAMVGRFFGAAILRVISPGKVLTAAAVGSILLIIISIVSTGKIAGWTLIAVGLCNSIMFPTIFSLALEGLGNRTAQGSGLLCMSIVGGAFIPLFTGVVADLTSLSMALTIPALCYAFIAAYGRIVLNTKSID